MNIILIFLAFGAFSINSFPRVAARIPQLSLDQLAKALLVAALLFHFGA